MSPRGGANSLVERAELRVDLALGRALGRCRLAISVALLLRAPRAPTALSFWSNARSSAAVFLWAAFSAEAASLAAVRSAAAASFALAFSMAASAFCAAASFALEAASASLWTIWRARRAVAVTG